MKIRRQNDSASAGGKFWTWLQRSLLIVGVVLIGLVGSVWMESYLGSRAALKAFDSAPPSITSRAGEGTGDSLEKPPASIEGPAAVVSAESHEPKRGMPIAVLVIPAIHLKVPVFDGADASTLDHGVGRISGTSHPGQKGNIAIAGHRDTYFRGLKHLKSGDRIDLKLHGITEAYVVDRMQIVSPQDVGVLRATETPTVTLVTCYPFNFVGSAPKRFVVTAHLMRDSAAGSTANDTPANPSTL